MIMTVQELASGLGTSALVDELKAIEPQLSRRQFKRLLSTTIAQLLELDPDIKKGRARRWAHKATGVKPSKKALKAVGNGTANKDAESAPEETEAAEA
jgi:hypothetical protein